MWCDTQHFYTDKRKRVCPSFRFVRFSVNLFFVHEKLFSVSEYRARKSTDRRRQNPVRNRPRSRDSRGPAARVRKCVKWLQVHAFICDPLPLKVGAFNMQL